MERGNTVYTANVKRPRLISNLKTNPYAIDSGMQGIACYNMFLCIYIEKSSKKLVFWRQFFWFGAIFSPYKSIFAFLVLILPFFLMQIVMNIILCDAKYKNYLHNKDEKCDNW